MTRSDAKKNNPMVTESPAQHYPFRTFFANVMYDDPIVDASLPPHPVIVLDAGDILENLHDVMLLKEVFISNNVFENYVTDLFTHLVFKIDENKVIVPELDMVQHMQNYNFSEINHNQLYSNMVMLSASVLSDMMKGKFFNYAELSLLRVEYKYFYYRLEEVTG